MPDLTAKIPYNVLRAGRTYVPEWVGAGSGKRQLRLGEAHVYGTATFYSELRLTPPPQKRVDWCSSE